MNTAVLQRFHHNESCTQGALYLDGKFLCWILEDPPQEKKILGKTRIPAGRYQIKLRRVGGFHRRYLSRFVEFHKGMLWLQDVPGFEYILVHCGNGPGDTGGCLLTGTDAHSDTQIAASEQAYRRVYPVLVPMIERGDLWIEVRDEVSTLPSAT